MKIRSHVAAAVLVTVAAFVVIGCQESVPTLPSTPPPGAVVVSANQQQFEQAVVNVPASTPFTIWFENRESVPHNVNVVDVAGASQAKGDIFTGPAARALEVPALAAGNYRIICDVHPDMSAQVIAQ